MSTPPPPSLPPSLAANPRIADWLVFREDGRLAVRSGKVELGQGVLTALAQIVAEELDVGVDRIAMLPVSTSVAPDEGYTAGSLSVQQSGAALRQVSAEARAILLRAAATRWDVPEAALTVADGTITAPDGRSTTYWSLDAAPLLDRPATGEAAPKPVSAYRVVGTSTPRLDLPDKLAPRPRFAHDLPLDATGDRTYVTRQASGPAPALGEVGALLHGRVVRPPSRGAELAAVDADAVRGMDGVLAVVRDGGFLGVVAEREEVALRAADRLRDAARWHERATLPDEDDLPAYLTAAPAETGVLAEAGEPPGPVARTYEGVFHRPYLAHAAMGPSTATAMAVADGSLDVWTHSQGPHVLRRELARVLGTDRITVRHAEGSGCYGHNGADDVALDAALLARAVPGRMVQVVWSRADELGWAPFGPAAVVRVAADVDARGDVLAWRHEIWGNGHSSRPGSLDTPSLLAAPDLDGGAPIPPSVDPPLDRGGGAGRNAVPGYAFPAYRVLNHRLTVMPLRTSALRSLGATANVFAIESLMDDLARAAGRDPLAYRLDHLTDPRARAVLTAAARRADWPHRAGSESTGHGIGYARYKNTGAYCAVVAEVEATTEVRVRRLTIAVDAGLIINPDGAENQIEGGAIQATSWALKERVRFDGRRVTSDTWETYPILRFSEVPEVRVEFLPAAGHPSTGTGEAAQGPTVAAIANAVHDALGVRVRALPLTPDRIIAAMPD